MNGYINALGRGMHAVLAAATITMLAGCAVGLDSVPLPTPDAGGQSYAVTAVFSDALNLPTKAKVKLLGADIGEVDSIQAQDFNARVNLRIRSDVPLSVGSTAELRSATLLGDVFVAIKPPLREDPNARLLRDGDEIELPSTAAAPTVEELLDSMAMLVNGGTIRYLMNSLNGAGRAIGGRGDKVGLLLDESTTLLSRMNARSGQLTTALRHTSELAATMAARRQTLTESLSAGAPALAVVADNSNRIADLTEGIARITRQLYRFPSIRGTDTRSTVGDLNNLAKVFNDISVDPNLSLMPFNRLIGILMKVLAATSLHMSATIQKLAPVLPWPDINYPGDEAFHWTDGTDWHQMIGSLRYEWNMLLAKVYGTDR